MFLPYSVYSYLPTVNPPVKYHVFVVSKLAASWGISVEIYLEASRRDTQAYTGRQNLRNAGNPNSIEDKCVQEVQSFGLITTDTRMMIKVVFSE
jgi:hypothetical protein